jgi:hypothetical protein
VNGLKPSIAIIDEMSSFDPEQFDRLLADMKRRQEYAEQKCREQERKFKQRQLEAELYAQFISMKFIFLGSNQNPSDDQIKKNWDSILGKEKEIKDVKVRTVPKDQAVAPIDQPTGTRRVGWFAALFRWR